ncbi:hypothetical protein CUMW_058890 [Citrus unshiu]|nr:hypothetical protein CUMW_058890 [Citrus unshiu]
MYLQILLQVLEDCALDYAVELWIFFSLCDRLEEAIFLAFFNICKALETIKSIDMNAAMCIAWGILQLSEKCSAPCPAMDWSYLHACDLLVSPSLLALNYNLL